MTDVEALLESYADGSLSAEDAAGQLTAAVRQLPSSTDALLVALANAVRRGQLAEDIEASWRSGIVAASAETQFRSDSRPTPVDSGGGPPVMASEIERLPDLCGFFKVASGPEWRRVRLTPDV
jgi:hypothetical protein